MNRNPVTSSLSVRVMAVASALGMTAAVLLGVDVLAQQRSLSPYAQVVHLERVVVTGQRLANAPSIVTTAAARSGKKDHCDVAARDAAASTTC